MIIGMSGAAGAGKDTVADFLVANHGFRKFALATKMKEAALALDPIVGYHYVAGELHEPVDKVVPIRLSELIDKYGPEKAKEHPEVRRTYQRMGTEVGRNTLWEDMWIRKVFDLVDADFKGKNIVISDVRFLNEARYIGVTRRGYVFRVIRPGAGLEGELADHISETQLSDASEGIYDGFIHNDGTLGDLEEKVAKLIAGILPGLRN